MAARWSWSPMTRGWTCFSFTARVIKDPTNLSWSWEFLNQDKIDFLVVVVLQQHSGSVRSSLKDLLRPLLGRK